MAEVIKRAVCYANNAKIAECESSDYSENTNGEQQHGQDGVIGISVGNQEVEIRVNIIRTLNPKTGMQIIEDAIRTQSYLDFAYKVGAKMIFAKFKCVSRNYTSDSRTGTLKGNFVFRNGENPREA